MNPYLVNHNPFLKTKDALLMSIAEATVASFKLEGIVISLEEAYKMAVASAKRRTKIAS